jgi:hypothetical protein
MSILVTFYDDDMFQILLFNGSPLMGGREIKKHGNSQQKEISSRDIALFRLTSFQFFNYSAY